MRTDLTLPTRGITWGDDREEGDDQESCDSCGKPAFGTLVDDEDGGLVFEYTHKCGECRNGLCDDCRAVAAREDFCPACLKEHSMTEKKTVRKSDEEQFQSLVARANEARMRAARKKDPEIREHEKCRDHLLSLSQDGDLDTAVRDQCEAMAETMFKLIAEAVVRAVPR